MKLRFDQCFSFDGFFMNSMDFFVNLKDFLFPFKGENLVNND